MWSIVKSKIFPSNIGVISFGAPNHTFKYMYATHIVNTKGSLSLNVMNNIFHDNFVMKAEPSCHLALNSCGTSTNAISLNSPFGGVQMNSKEYSVKVNQFIVRTDSFSLKINEDCFMKLSKNQLYIKAPEIILDSKTKKYVSMKENEAGSNSLEGSDKCRIKNHEGETIFSIDELNADVFIRGNLIVGRLNIKEQFRWTVGRGCSFETLNDAVECIENLDTRETIVIHVRNNKEYSENLCITKSNVSFVGETGGVHFYGRLQYVVDGIQSNSQEEVRFMNFTFHTPEQTMFEKRQYPVCDFIIPNVSLCLHNCTIVGSSLYITECERFELIHITCVDSTLFVHSKNVSEMRGIVFKQTVHDTEDMTLCSGSCKINIDNIIHNYKNVSEFSKEVEISEFKKIG